MLRRLMLLVAPAVIAIAGGSAYADPLLYLSTYSPDNKVYTVNTNATLTQYQPGLNGGGGMAFDSSGNLYVANYDNGTVVQITPSHQVSTYASGFQNPVGLAFDPAGNLYVTNSGNGAGSTITKVTPQLQNSVFATGLHQPLDITYGTDGYLYVANGGNGAAGQGFVSKVASDGSWTTYVAGLNGPGALTLDAQGDLFVQDETAANTSRILEFTPAHVQTTFATGFGNLYSMKFASDGNLYVASYGGTGGGEIMEVGPGGGAATPFITGITNPTGLVAIPEPSSLGLVAISSVALIFRRRRGATKL